MPVARAAADVAGGARPTLAYVVTDHAGRGADGREWDSGVTHTTAGEVEPLIRCYTTPKLAQLDLRDLAERALVKSAMPILSPRGPLAPAPGRILRTLPA